MNPLHRKNLWLCLVAVVLTASQVHAQRKLALSARQAVDTALKNVTALKNLQLDKKIQEALNREITGQAYPQLSGSAAITRYFSIPITSIPDFISPALYDVLKRNNIKDGNGNPIVSPTSYSVFQAGFGVPWTASAGFSFEQLLFQSDVFVGLKARAASIDYANNNIAVMADSIKTNVYRSYYGVVIALKRLGFINESVLRLEKLYHDQNEMYKNGFAEKLDLEKTEVNLNNLKTLQSQLTNLIELGNAALKFSMALPNKDELVLTDTLSADGVKSGLLNDGGFRYEDRPEFNLLSITKKLQQLNVQRYKLAYIPTVSAFWNFSKNAQRQKFDIFKANRPWYKTSLVGLNINIPLFDGFQKDSRIRQAQLNVQKINNIQEELQRVIDFQQAAAKIQVKNALASLQVQERNLSLSQSVYAKTKIKFEQGIGSSFEIIQAETSLEESQSNYFQALYDAVIAKLEFNRAIGKL